MKDNTSNNPVLAITNGQINIQSALDRIDQELKNIGDQSDSKYTVGGDVDGFAHNLKNMTSIEDVIKLYASLKSRDEAFTKAQMELNVKNARPFTYGGFELDIWKKDCLFRISILTSAERKAKLEEARAIIASQMSEEERRRMEMAKAATLLNEIGYTSEPSTDATATVV